MKSSVLIAILIIAVSIACTYKSAGSQPVTNHNLALQTQTQTQTQTPGPPGALAQEKVPCTLKLAGAPAINGLRLGLTTDEVLALFPGSKDDPEVQRYVSAPPRKFGVSELLIHPEKYQSKDRFTGLRQIMFTFLDGRVSTLNVGFNGPEYAHVDKFVEQFVSGKGLPTVDQWDPYAGQDNTLKILKCTEFEVRVFAGGQGGNLNYVLLKDLEADKKVKDRRAKAAAQATPTPGQ